MKYMLIRHGLGILLLAGGFRAESAFAQTCAAFNPVQNPTFTHTILAPNTVANWTLGGWGGDNAGTTGIWAIANTAGPFTLSQTIYGVAPNSQVVFNMRWGNGIGLDADNDGNQYRLEVRYNNVVYARFDTSPYVSATLNLAPGPTAGATYAALNGATLTPTVPTPWASQVTTTYALTLPTGIPGSAALEFVATRLQNVDDAGDDFYVDSASVDTTTLCLRKTSVNGTGTFNFSGAVNLDTNLITAGAQTAAAITTVASNTPVAYDAASTIYTGIQPMMVITPGTGASVTETPAAGLVLTSASCDNGVSASVSGSVATFGAVPLRADVTCTVVNSLPFPLTAVKSLVAFSDPVNGATNPKMIPGGFVDYTISVNNPSTNSVSSSGIFVTDAVPVRTKLFVNTVSPGPGPLVMTPGASGLTYTFTSLSSTTDDIDFSCDSGTTFTCVPAPDASGISSTVTNIRVNPKGNMAPNSTFTLRFRVGIQ